jgi:uncharacterized cupin superfamily protein
MSDLFLRVTTEIEAEEDAPPADRVISGAPSFRTWNTEERNAHYCGIWEFTRGRWCIS